jgi:hypothetical protein
MSHYIPRKKRHRIDEVIVTAQGSQKTKRNRLCVCSCQPDITVGRSQLAQALSGKVSGLAIYNVNNSGSRVGYHRGYRSLTGNNEALLVIDGMPVKHHLHYSIQMMLKM